MIKRLFDIWFSILLLTLLSWVMAIVAIIIKITLGSPVFFVQERAGLQGRAFQMVKFRTMTNQTDESGELLSDRSRLTRIGRVLRATSLDELPTLWNVLSGDMSLVGPRPLLTEYLPLYSKRQARRHDVRPGITGWAQVNGRNRLSWTEKFALDVWYVENQSLGLDLAILVRTIMQVMLCRDIRQTGEATAQKFRGEKDWGES